MVQNFVVLADRSASAKIKTAKIAARAISIVLCLPVHTGAAKISWRALRSEAISQNFAPVKISCYMVHVHVHVSAHT